MFDGDESEQPLNYSNSFNLNSFFILERRPEKYEFSDIDMRKRRI
jgi:hypothetical protein